MGLVVDGELAWFHGYGTTALDQGSAVDADTVFSIGSITKTFTTVELLRLRDEGKLSLDAPAADYLPELAGVVYPTDDAPPITVRHLLTHTSGLPSTGALDAGVPVPTEASVLGALRGLHLRSAPGVKKSYSALGFGLLGIIVERVTRRSLHEVLRADVLRPLGMTATTWEESEVPRDRLATGYEVRLDDALVKAPPWKLGAFEGGGMLYSSVRDMARWLAFHLDAWPARTGVDAGPLSRGSLREMQTLQVVDDVGVSHGDGDPPDDRVMGVGLGWGAQYWCGVGTTFNHAGAGAGYAANLMAFPEEGIGIVWLANEFTPHGDVFKGSGWGGIIDILRETGGFERRVALPDPALAGARDHLIQVLFDRFDEHEASRLFGTPFEALAPPDWAAGRLAGVRERHGACKLERDLPPRHAMQARWLMSCDRGKVEVRADVATVSPLVIDGHGWGFAIDEVPESTDTAAAHDPRCAQ